MEYRLKDVIGSLEYNELMKMREDINKGGFHLKKFLDVTIKQKEHDHATHCTTCSNKLKPTDANNFTLVFGPADFKKKASFCGIDCMEYFLSELKQVKKVLQ